MKKRLVHTITLLIAIIVACIGVAGCSNGDEELEELKNRELTTGITYSANIILQALAESGLDYEECTLSLSCSEDDTVIYNMKNAITAFEKEYPGIKINLVTVSEDVQEADGETKGDITDTEIQDISEIEWNAFYNRITDEEFYYDLYKEYEVLNLGTFGQEYLNLCTVSGTLQALPVSVSGRVFAFNESIFEQAGIEVPNTLEDLMAAGLVFEDVLGENYYPLAVNIEDRIELLIYYLQTKYGRAWMVDGVLQYNIEEIEEGLTFLSDLEEAHVIPTLPLMRGKDEYARDAGWSSGYYAGIFVYDVKLAQYAENAPQDSNITVAERFKDMGIFNGGYVGVETAFAVSNNCSNPREAALFLDYIFNGENGVKELKDSYGMPLSRVAKQYGKDNGLWNSVYQEANEIAVESDFLMDDEYRTMMEDTSIFSEIIIGLSYGDYNVREAAQIFMGSF